MQDKLNGEPPAKAPDDAWRRDKASPQPPETPEEQQDKRRPGHRHELASALAILETLCSAQPTHNALAWPDGLDNPHIGSSAIDSVITEQDEDGEWLVVEQGDPEELLDATIDRIIGAEHATTNVSVDDPLVQELAALSADEIDLLVYLVAAHHGKVRMSLRTSPDDERDDVRRRPISGKRAADCRASQEEDRAGKEANP